MLFMSHIAITENNLTCLYFRLLSFLNSLTNHESHVKRFSEGFCDYPLVLAYMS